MLVRLVCIVSMLGGVLTGPIVSFAAEGHDSTQTGDFLLTQKGENTGGISGSIGPRNIPPALHPLGKPQRLQQDPCQNRFPDVCITPTPSGGGPVPYPNTGKENKDGESGSKKVKGKSRNSEARKKH